MRRNYIIFTQSLICIKMYLNSIKLGSNIKLSVLELVVHFKFWIFASRQQFSYAKKTVKMGRRDDI